MLTLRVGHKKPIEAPVARNPIVLLTLLFIVVLCLRFIVVSCVYCLLFIVVSSVYCRLFIVVSSVYCLLLCLLSTVYCSLLCRLSTVYCLFLCPIIVSIVQHSALRTTNQPPLSPLFHRNLWNTGQMRPQNRAQRSSLCLLVNRSVCLCASRGDKEKRQNDRLLTHVAEVQ